MVCTNTPFHSSLQSDSMGNYYQTPKPTEQHSILRTLLCVFFTFTLVLIGQRANAQCGPGEDTTAPNIICNDVTVPIGSNGISTLDPDEVTFGSTDNCGIENIAIDLNDHDDDNLIECEDLDGNNPQCMTTLTALITATDAAGNSSMCNAIVTILDNRPPEIDVAAIPNRLYNCDNLPFGFPSPASTGDAEPGTTDNCGVMSVTYSDSPGLTTGPHCFIIDRTWTATDTCGNVSTHLQTLTVEDNETPMFDNSFPDDRTVDCDDPIALYSNGSPNDPPALNPTITPLAGDELSTADFEDNCSPDADITINRVSRDSRYVFNSPNYELKYGPDDCEFYNYTITHTWTVTDECGNANTQTQTITVEDDTDPTFVGSDLPTGTITVPAINACGATFPNVFANLDLRDNVDDDCAGTHNAITGMYSYTGTSSNSGSTLNANGTYPVGMYNFTYTASDPCGNEATHSFTIVIVDNVPPTAKCQDLIASIPPSGTLIVDPADIDNGSVDNCSEVTLSLNPNTFDCNDIGNMEDVTLTVTDAGGNAANCTAEVTIVDEAGPAPLCKDIMAFLDASGNVTVDPMDVDNGSYDACDYGNGSNGIDWANSSVSPSSFDCDELGNNTVTLTVADYANPFNTSTCTAVVTVKDTLDPIINCMPYTAQLDATGNAIIEPGWLIGGGYNLVITSGDNGSGTAGANNYVATGSGTTTVMFDWDYSTEDATATADSAGYVLNGVFTSLISGAATSQSGTGVSVNIADRDVFGFMMRTTNNRGGRGKLIISNFSPGFTDEFAPPEWTRNSNNSDGNAWIVGDDLSDNCADYCTLIENLSASTTMVDCDDIPSVTVTVTTSDGNGNSEDCTSTVTVSDMIDPMPECKDFAAQLDETTGAGAVAVEPGWLIDGEKKLYMQSGINPFNGQTPMVGHTEYTVKVKTPTSITFNWDYEQTGSCGTDPSFAGRDPFGYVLNGTFTRLTAGAVATNNGVAVQSGTETVTLSQGDVFGFRTESHDTISCIGSAKIVVSFSTPDFFTGDFDPVQWERDNDETSWSKYMFRTYEGVFISGTNIGDACTDICDVEMYINDNGSADMDNSSPAPYAYYNCEDVGNTYPATISVTDEGGNTGSCTADLTIVDEIDPVINFCPTSQNAILDANGEYDAEGGFGNLIALFSTDNCKVDDYTTEPAMLDCSHVGQTITVKTTVFDPSDNSTFCETQVTVQDNSEPELVCPANMTVDCGDSTDPSDTGMATATDNCGSVAVTWSDNPANPNQPNCTNISRTWRAEDAGGNIDECVQIITVEDGEDPVLSALPADTLINCRPPDAASLTASDNCDTDVAVVVSDDDGRDTDGDGAITDNTHPSQCAYYTYTHIRTYTATDDCGNDVVHTQMIMVQDTTRPAISYPTTVTRSTDVNLCFATVNLDFTGSATDCANEPYLTYSPSGVSNTYAPGSYPMSFTVTDPCGNANTHDFTLVVEDNQVPQVITQDITVTLAGSNPSSITPQEIDNGSSDACGIANLELNISTFDCSNLGENEVILTVTDNNGNMHSGPATVTVVSDDPNVSLNLTASATDESFAGANDGTVSVSIAGGSGNFTILWDDPNSSSTTLVTGLAPGTYTVNVMDNDTGCSGTASATVGSGPTSSLRFIASMTSGGPNTSAKIAVTTENFTNVEGFSFSLDVLDINVADVTGISGVHPTLSTPGSFLTLEETSPGSNVITIAWIGGSSAMITNGSTLFFIDIALGSTIGAMTDVDFIGTPTPILATQGGVQSMPLTTDGKVTIVNAPPNVILSGLLETELGVGIHNVNVNLTGTSPNAQIANDSYSFNVPSGGNYTVTPLKNNDLHNNGVNIFDLNILLPYIGGDFGQITSPYKLLAADVDLSGQINIFDFIEVLRVIGDPDPSNGGGFTTVTSWGFADASAVIAIPPGPAAPASPPTFIAYNNVTTSQTNGDFIGYKYGDVDCNANPESLRGDVVELRNDESLILTTANRAIKAGKTYQLDFTAKAFNAIKAYQFTLNFDKAYLQFFDVSFNENTPLNSDYFFTNGKEDGRLTSVWYNINEAEVAPDAVLFSLTFQALQDAAQLSDLLQISSDITPAVAATWADRPINVEVSFSDLLNTSPTLAHTTFELHQNRPNPFSDETIISFNLPEQANAQLSIMDISGKIVKVYKGTFQQGYNELKIQASDLPNAQILYYKLESAAHTAVRKMTSIK